PLLRRRQCKGDQRLPRNAVASTKTPSAQPTLRVPSCGSRGGLRFPHISPTGRPTEAVSPSAVDTHGHNPTPRKEGAAEAQDQVGRGLKRRAPVRTGSGAVVAQVAEWGQA